MKLMDAIKEKGEPFWIPDCTRAELPAFFAEYGFKKGVEVGVSWGQNMVDYCEAGLEMYGIDPWMDYPDEPFKKVISIQGKYGRSPDGVYQLAQERLSKYPNCTLIRKTSTDAVNDFKKRSLDFVYIDGNHKFGYVAMDLMKWSDKVRKGGVIAGHDYWNTTNPRLFRGVRYAVEAYAKAWDYANWYVIGKPGEGKHDRELSYMFFKHW